MAQITGGPHRGHAAGDTDVEKAASQLVSDVKYKVNKEMKAKGGASNLNPAQVAQKYMEKLNASPAPGPVKAIARKKLGGVKEEYGISDLAKDSIIEALSQIFVEGSEDDTRVWAVIKDKKTGNTYRRSFKKEVASSKIAELRANPNIASVERTGYHPDEDDEKGQKTAAVKSGKGLAKRDYDGDKKVESSAKEHAGAVHNAIQRKRGLPADGKDTSSVKEEYLREVKSQKKDDKKITGDGVNNSKYINLKPTMEQSEVETQQTSGTKPSDDEKKKLKLRQQQVNAALTRQRQTMQLQKSGRLPLNYSDDYSPEGDDIQEVAPPGFEGTVKGMKKHPELSTGETKEGKKKNIYALAWWMKNKGYESHKKASGAMKEESCECEDGSSTAKTLKSDKKDPRGYATDVENVKHQLRSRGLKMSYEPEGELVDEAQAMGKARSTDTNPKGAAVRVSSGRGMTMTPARGLGASKPAGDDAARSARQKAQAKADRIAAAKDRAASGEDRLGRLIRSVQKNSFQPEGEVIGEEDYDRMKDKHLERGGMGARSSTTPAKSGSSKPVDPKKHAETSKKALDLVRQSIIAKHGKSALM